MSHSWIFFLGCSLISILIQGFFALFEMACVSFNKVRLQYFVSLGKKRAIWLSELIQQPSRLFGTTLIGIASSLQIGSEFARKFYESIGFNPDFAPITQVFLVLIFGEMVPMFAARRHPEQLAMAFAPFMILISRILSPIIWAFGWMAKLIHKMIGKEESAPLFLSREEVQKTFETGENAKDDFNAVVAKIFRMKSLLARQFMSPIDATQLISSSASIVEARRQLSIRYTPFILVYHRQLQNIVGLTQLRDLLHLDQKKKILDAAKPPWFVTQDTSLLQILDQFRRNNQSIAVILDAAGQAIGVLSLDQIVDAIFGPERSLPSSETEKGGLLYVERTVPGSMTIEEFNRDFSTQLVFKEGNTISDFIVERLNHAPAKGESIEIGPYELTVLEPTLRGARLISVKTIE